MHVCSQWGCSIDGMVRTLTPTVQDQVASSYFTTHSPIKSTVILESAINGVLSQLHHVTNSNHQKQNQALPVRPLYSFLQSTGPPQITSSSIYAHAASVSLIFC